MAKESRTLPGEFISPSLESLDRLDVDALVLCIPEDTRPLRGAAGFLDWRLGGAISALIKKRYITGERGEQVLTAPGGGLKIGRIFLFGWGPSSKVDDDGRTRLAHVVKVLEDAGVKSVAIDLPYPGEELLDLVDACLRKPLGAKLVGVFAPEPQE